MQQAGDWGGVARVAVEAALRGKPSGAQGLLLASNTLHKDGIVTKVERSALGSRE